MRWHLLIEEYSLKLTYIKGEKNIVADALSKLEIDSSDSTPPDSLEQLLLNNMECLLQILSCLVQFILLVFNFSINNNS